MDAKDVEVDGGNFSKVDLVLLEEGFDEFEIPWGSDGTLKTEMFVYVGSSLESTFITPV